MKYKVILLSWLLVITLCVGACKKTLMKVEKEQLDGMSESINNFEVEMGSEQNESTPLVKEWNPKMLHNLRGINTSRVDEFIELLVKVIDQEDIVSLQNLFAPNVRENGQISEDVERLFAFLDGKVVSFKRVGLSKSDKKEQEHRKAELEFSCDIETDVCVYRLAGKLCMIDSEDINNVGICSLYIIDAKNTNIEFTYWGDNEWRQGIVFDYNRYD